MSRSICLCVFFCLVVSFSRIATDSINNDDFDMFVTVPYMLLKKYHIAQTSPTDSHNIFMTSSSSSDRYSNLDGSEDYQKLENVKRMNINSNANIQIPMELAKEMGLLKNLANGFCKDDANRSLYQQSNPTLVRNLCGKVDSKAGVNSDMNPQLPGFPTFSIGGGQPSSGNPDSSSQDVLTINLKGKDGKKGKTGPKGPHGDRGPIGPQGQPGERGDKGENCLAENLIHQSKCDSEKIQRIKERLDRIETECAKNASLLASITLSVVTSLTQARPTKTQNPDSATLQSLDSQKAKMQEKMDENYNSISKKLKAPENHGRRKRSSIIFRRLTLEHDLLSLLKGTKKYS